MQIITNQFQKEMKSHGEYYFPILVSHEQLSRYETGSFLWHWHPEIELTYIDKGQMTYQVNHNVFHLKQGELLFGNASTLHTGYMYQKEDCEYTSITFDPRLIYGFSQSIICQKYVEPITQDFSMAAIHLDHSQNWHISMIASIRNIIDLYEKMPNSYELDISIELQSMWKILFTNCQSNTVPYSVHQRTEYERIKEIMSYLEHHYSEKIRLADIASHIHLCESECSRLFKRYMNISLFTFLLDYRIDRSLEYLSDPAISITDIASMVGFTDSNYYSKTFIKRKGCSPFQYRKSKMNS
jgi:AraC-like DNA-binding protein